MVIHQFNRLIRNKAIWGVIAVAFCAFFALDFLFTGDTPASRGERSAGTLGGEDVDARLFADLVREFRGFGGSRERELDNAAANRGAWETLAALKVAEELGFSASDDEVNKTIAADPSFRNELGAFDRNRLLAVLQQVNLTPAAFRSYLARRLALAKVAALASGSTAWVSPMELDRELDDVTDVFTVKVASFTDKDSGKVTIDEAGIKAYYEANTNSFALPDCMRVRYVKVMGDTPARLARFKPSEDAMRDHYDAIQTRFETQTTNGVVTKAFEEVKDEVARDLQLIDSLEALRSQLLARAYPEENTNAAKRTSVLDAVAAEEKATVKTSPLFSPAGKRVVPGFMGAPSDFAPDADGFLDVAAELDPESEFSRFGAIVGSNAVYLVECVELVPAHVPAFAEAKDVIRGEALADARAKAFKKAVEAKRTLVAAALAKGGAFDAKTLGAANVTTSLVFSVATLGGSSAPVLRTVASSVMKAAKGTVTDFIPGFSAKDGYLVYVENRVPGDRIQASMIRDQIRSGLTSAHAAQAARAWNEWNLARIGFETQSFASTEAAEDEGAVQED